MLQRQCHAASALLSQNLHHQTHRPDHWKQCGKAPSPRGLYFFPIDCFHLCSVLLSDSLTLSTNRVRHVMGACFELAKCCKARAPIVVLLAIERLLDETNDAAQCHCTQGSVVKAACTDDVVKFSLRARPWLPAGHPAL
jgi:hypothetical protein